MVFNRNVDLIGPDRLPGSAFGVDVSADGQYVAGSAKAVHANPFGSERAHRVDPVTASADANADSYACRDTNTNTYSHANGYTDSYS